MFPKQCFQKSAFSLIELVAMVLIMGVLVSLAVTSYDILIERMKSSEGTSCLIAILGSQKRWASDNGTYTTLLSNLDWKMPAAFWTKFTPTFPGTATLTGPNANNILVNLHRNESAFDYTLHITASTGTISCTNGGVAGICTKLGF